MPVTIDYRVRKVERYIITRFETSSPDENGCAHGGSEERGEFSSPYIAQEIAHALGKMEQTSALDANVNYPDMPKAGVPLAAE